MKLPRRKSMWGAAVLFLTLLHVGYVHVGDARGDEFLSSGKFFQQLAAPLNLVIEGQPFREAVMAVAARGEVNVWIDRAVDPSEPVSPGQIGPSVIAALQKISQQRDCVVMPVANVVLVGREPWVDATSDALITLPSSRVTANIQWDDLTTPAQAYLLAVGKSAPSNIRLPHDLWPATKFDNVRRPIAANLVLSQFGRHLSSTKTMDPRASVVNKSNQLVKRTYTTSESIESVFANTSDANANAAGKAAKFKTVGDKTYVSALPKSHRLATHMLLAEKTVAKPPMPGKNILQDDRQFSLKLVNKQAGIAIESFAKTASAKCVISPAAVGAAQKLVSFDATNKTLAELIDLVAEQSGLQVTWDNNTVTVDLAK